jgi:membrane protein
MVDAMPAGFSPCRRQDDAMQVDSSARYRDADRRRFRSAPALWQISASGWKHILLQVYGSLSDDRIFANAAAVSFYALLALFPGIAALVSIYGLFADPRAIGGHLSLVAGVLPGGAIDVLRDDLTRLTHQKPATLGIGFVVSLVVSLWSANGGVKAFFEALNAVYGKREERSFIVLNLISMLFTIGIILFLILTIICIVAIPALLRHSATSDEWVVDIARWPVFLLLSGIGITVILRYGPSRNQAPRRWITWGGACAAFAWLAASVLFSWYAANFGSFNKTYGSLGAVVGLMTWLWLSISVLLVGAKLDAEIEHRIMRESMPEPPDG